MLLILMVSEEETRPDSSSRAELVARAEVARVDTDRAEESEPSSLVSRGSVKHNTS